MLYFLNVGTVPMLYFLNVGTVPMLYFLNVGTVPMLYFLNVGTVPTSSHSHDQYAECSTRQEQDSQRSSQVAKFIRQICFV